MRRVSIAPADRFRRLVVVATVATNLPGEISDGRKDAAGEELAFNVGKPELDLIEPGRIRRREMQVHVRMIQQKRSDGLGFVRRQIVGDDVNRPALRLRGDDVAEEFDKGGAGVPRHGLTKDFAGLRVEGGQQRERAMAVILEPNRTLWLL